MQTRLRPTRPTCSCSRQRTTTRPLRLHTSLVMATAQPQQQAPGGKRVVICGGGIIGVATAYFLATAHGVPAVVVERDGGGVAAAASGKAGGFLALDWNDGSPVGPLARRSYALHAQLAAKLGAEAIGYREVDTIQVVGQAGGQAPGRKPAHLPSWLDGNISRSSTLGTKTTTAQVHPAKLTRALMVAAQQAAGAQLVTGTVTGVDTQGGAVTAVRVQQPSGGELQLPADAVVIAMGPWSGDARAWLPTAPSTTGQKYHSVVLRPAQPVSDTAVFTAYRTADGRSIEPELYPRPDGTVYVCGEPASVPVPEQGPAGVTVEQPCLRVLQDMAGSLASSLAGAAVEAAQACYLPLSSDGLPVIGRLPHVEGAFVATGHSCWGILNGPATGEALAELIVAGRSSSVDLAAFDPARCARRPAAGRRRS